MRIWWQKLKVWYLRRKMFGEIVRVVDPARPNSQWIGRVSRVELAFPGKGAIYSVEVRYAVPDKSHVLGWRFVNALVSHRDVRWNDRANCLEITHSAEA